MAEPKKVEGPGWMAGQEEGKEAKEPKAREPRPEPKPREIVFEESRPLVVERLTIPTPERRKGLFDRAVDKLFGAPKPRARLSEEGLTKAGFAFFTVRAN